MSNLEPTMPLTFAFSDKDVSILEMLLYPLVFIDKEGMILYVNAAAASSFGATKGELLGCTFWQCAPHLVSLELYRGFLNVMRTQEPQQVEYRSLVNRTWLHVYLLPTHGGVALHIHEEKEPMRSQDSLRQCEQLFQDLLMSLPLDLAIMTPEGRILSVSREVLEVAQIQQVVEVIGKFLVTTPLCFCSPCVQEQWRAAIEEARNGTTVLFETKMCSRTGGDLDLVVTITPHFDTDENIDFLIWTGLDITTYKQDNAALLQSQERLNALMNSNIIGIYLAKDTLIVEANDTFLRMIGYTREELRAGCLNWVALTAPEDLSRTWQAHQELANRQQIIPYEKEYICKDGHRLPVLVGGVALQQEPHHCIYIVLDNSSQRETVRRKNDFINIAGHELKTPLTALKLQTQLVKRRLEKQGLHEAAEALKKVEEPVRRLERMVEEFLDVSKIQTGKMEYHQESVNLDEMLHEVIETVQPTSKDHAIEVHSLGPLTLIGDRLRLEQVFTNLISNAIKYSPDANLVKIDMSASVEAVTVSVRDYGIGIPKEQCEKIFERFYRVCDPKQKVVSGLGMGLYIAAEIVKGHGGGIWVESEEGKGSIFHVALPFKK